MKMNCRVDGLHFPQDFEETLKPPCNLWGELGLSNLDLELKKKFWDWYFAMPADEISIKAKVVMGVQFVVSAVRKEDEWKNKVAGYEDLTEKEQQELQREYCRRRNDGEDAEAWLKTVDLTALDSDLTN